MLKKTIKYTDFNGNEVTEDFYFNLTKAEVAEMELGASRLDADGNIKGGMQDLLAEIVASGSGQRIMDTFKEILARSYGMRSEDGKRFIKSKELFEEFTQSAAYSEFFMELITDADAASSFIKAVMPADLAVESDKPKPQPPKSN
jgi:hypothetical protein